MDKLARDAKAAREAGLSYGQYMAQKNRLRDPDAPPHGTKLVKCAYCGRVFKVYKTQGVRRYCNDQCKEKARYRRRTEGGEKNG